MEKIPCMKKAILSLASLGLLTFLVSIPTRADSVLTTISVGGGSNAVAANPVTNKVYVAVDNNAGQVVVINGKTQQITARIDIGRDTHSIAVNIRTNRIYATACSFNTASCDIAVIDGRTDSLITTIPIASGSGIVFAGREIIQAYSKTGIGEVLFDSLLKTWRGSDLFE